MARQCYQRALATETETIGANWETV